MLSPCAPGAQLRVYAHRPGRGVQLGPGRLLDLADDALAGLVLAASGAQGHRVGAELALRTLQGVSGAGERVALPASCPAQALQLGELPVGVCQRLLRLVEEAHAVLAAQGADAEVLRELARAVAEWGSSLPGPADGRVRVQIAGVKTLLIVTAVLAGCTTAPVTGRKQLNLIGDSTINQLGVQSYQQELAKAKTDTDPQHVDLVQRVSKRLADTAEAQFHPGYQWQTTVIDDPKTVNAWCMPGGKIAVYSGIFPITQDENG